PKAAKKPAARKPTPAKHAAAKSSRSSDYSQYSGKFTVRLPRSLHQALVDRAEKEGVSLNLFVTNALSRTVAGAKKKQIRLVCRSKKRRAYARRFLFVFEIVGARNDVDGQK